MNDDGAIGRLVLGRYRIVRRIAKGGMGTIYLARNEGAAGFVRPVVVKRILPGSLDEETATRLFQREARIMAHLRHPNVVDVIDFAQDDDGYTMVLEYVHGYHLAKWCYYVRKTHGRFPVEPAVHIVISVLDALSHAHRLEGPDGSSLCVVHRDIKPANVLIDIDGHVKLTDFGIAQMATDHTVSAADKGAVRGTFPYMPPELFESGEPGPTSDTYGCAVVLHEVLAGRNEFRVKDMSLTVARVLKHEPSRLDSLRPDVSAELADVVARALAKDPAERYPDAQALADALRRTRGAGAEEAQHQLAERARSDFRASRFAELLGADELDELDRAWREEPPASAKESKGPEAGEELEAPPTVDMGGARAASSSHRTGRGAARRVSRAQKLVAASALGILLGAGILYFALGRDGGGAQYIFVDGEVEPAGGDVEGSAESRHPPSETESPPDAADASATGPDEAPRDAEAQAEEVGEVVAAPPTGEAGITRAFRRRAPAVERCFEDHAEEAVGAPEIAVRFEIEQSGDVAHAELDPGEMMATELGGCVLRVAQATEFGPQDSALRVRIPIAVSRR